MTATIAIETIADAMFQLVSDYHGKKNLKAGDLIKTMQERFGADCTKEDCKKAIRILIDSGKCTYSYVGGSYIVLPPKEGDAA